MEGYFFSANQSGNDMKYSAYPKYKKSGVEWLGNVPEHWEVKKVKFIIKHIKIGPFGSDLTLDMMTDDGIKVYGQENLINNDFSLGDKFISDKKYEEMKVYTVEKDDILISMMGTIGKCRAVPENFKKGIINSHLIKIKVNQSFVHSIYLALIINDSGYIEYEINRQSFGTIMSGLNSSIVKSLSILLPPPAEQKAITSFLDRETERIDSLIGKKQKFVELLNEKRTALISAAVTGKIEIDGRGTMHRAPTRKMKPSGVEWLGNVPEHWEVKKLKWLYQGIGSGDGISPDDIESSGAYPVYGGNGIMGYTEKYNANGEDIIIGRVGAKCGNIYVVNGQKWISDNALLLHVNRVCKKYLALVLEERNLNQLANQNAQPLITGSMVGNQFIPVPPFSEQQAIAAFLDRETGKINALISKVEMAIAKLKEYRSTLISAAVTGKIDVSTGLNTSGQEVA